MTCFLHFFQTIAGVLIKVLKIVHKKVHPPQKKTFLKSDEKRLKTIQEKCAEKGLKVVQKSSVTSKCSKNSTEKVFSTKNMPQKAVSKALLENLTKPISSGVSSRALH